MVRDALHAAAASTMAAAENGSATLEEIRSALTKSRLKINAAWENDFLAVTKNGVPLKLVRG